MVFRCYTFNIMRIVFEDTDFLSMREAAKELGVSVMTLHRWVAKGKIQVMRVGTYSAIIKSEIGRLNRKELRELKK